MVTFIGLNLPHDVEQARIAFERCRMERHRLAKMLNTLEPVIGILNCDSAHYSMDLILLRQEELCQIRAVLACYSRD